jgi:hypothetical protein
MHGDVRKIALVELFGERFMNVARDRPLRDYYYHISRTVLATYNPSAEFRVSRANLIIHENRERDSYRDTE